MSDDRAATPEEQAVLDRIDGYRRKQPYNQVFQQPPGTWKVEADWEGAYYHASEKLIRGVVEGPYVRGLEGVAGVFLFRHYLELALKYIVLHARWLKDPETNASPKDVKKVNKTHSLKELWGMVKAEALPTIGKAERKSWDIGFVEKCVLDFHGVDPHPGTRFRYKEANSTEGYLWINFEQFLENMPHVREVLWMVDSYLVETYGMNAEWEAEMNSW